MCGIAGQVGLKPTPFNYQLFTTLGIDNDKRGGDSCGVFIDKRWEYGFGKTATFQSFYKESKLLNETTECQIALLHDRKASVGGVTLKAAQPVVLTDTNNNPEFIVIHNGTIYNYKELAQEYIPDVDIDGLTDSQVMARIFYHAGYKCLSEYEGSAVFVIVDYRGEAPTTLLFKGSSLPTKHEKEPSEERPLFYAVHNGVLYFSSLSTYLFTLSPDIAVYYLAENLLLEFAGKDKLRVISRHDRSTMCQKSSPIMTPMYQSCYNDGYFTADGTYHKYKNTTKPGTKPSNTSANSPTSRPRKVYFYANLVHDMNIPCDGEMNLGQNGEVLDKDDSKGTEMFFFYGVPIVDRNSYNYLHKKSLAANMTHAVYFQTHTNSVYFRSICNVYKDAFTQKWRRATSDSFYVPYTGNIRFLFSSKLIEANNGNQVKETWSGDFKTIKDIFKLYAKS